MIKQLLTVIVACLVMTPSIMAQTFEFRYHGEPVPDGGTVVIPAVYDEWFEEYSCHTNGSADPNYGLILKLISSTSSQASATIVIEENTLNPIRVQWCMGGLCSIINTSSFTKENFFISGGSEQVQFDAEGIRNEGVLLATLTATIGSETHSIQIKFTHGDVAVSGDVNGDGVCNSADVTALYQMILNNDDSKIVNGDQNGDNTINSADVTAVYRIILGGE